MRIAALAGRGPNVDADSGDSGESAPGRSPTGQGSAYLNGDKQNGRSTVVFGIRSHPSPGVDREGISTGHVGGMAYR